MEERDLTHMIASMSRYITSIWKVYKAARGMSRDGMKGMAVRMLELKENSLAAPPVSQPLILLA